MSAGFRCNDLLFCSLPCSVATYLSSLWQLGSAGRSTSSNQDVWNLQIVFNKLILICYWKYSRLRAEKKNPYTIICICVQSELQEGNLFPGVLEHATWSQVPCGTNSIHMHFFFLEGKKVCNCAMRNKNVSACCWNATLNFIRVVLKLVHILGNFLRSGSSEESWSFLRLLMWKTKPNPRGSV